MFFQLPGKDFRLSENRIQDFAVSQATWVLQTEQAKIFFIELHICLYVNTYSRHCPYMKIFPYLQIGPNTRQVDHSWLDIVKQADIDHASTVRDIMIRYRQASGNEFYIERQPGSSLVETGRLLMDRRSQTCSMYFSCVVLALRRLESSCRTFFPIEEHRLLFDQIYTDTL